MTKTRALPIKQDDPNAWTVWYSIDDDGIHLEHGCGADIAVGFFPTIEDLIDATGGHACPA